MESILLIAFSVFILWTIRLSVDMAVFRDLLRLKLPRLSQHLHHLQKAANKEAGGMDLCTSLQLGKFSIYTNWINTILTWVFLFKAAMSPHWPMCSLCNGSWPCLRPACPLTLCWRSGTRFSLRGQRCCFELHLPSGNDWESEWTNNDNCVSAYRLIAKHYAIIFNPLFIGG